jgi:hypothetical protein
LASDSTISFIPMPVWKTQTGVWFLRNEIDLLRAVTKYIVWTVADVAELADALDSKFHFRRFQGVTSRFN